MRFKLLSLFIFGLLLVGLVGASEAQLDLFPDSSSACPSHTAYYELAVKNTGPVQDTYRITSSDPDVITIAPDMITLDSGESYRDPHVWYTPKTTTEPGNYDFKLYVTSETTGQRYSIDGSIEVLACHDVDITPVSSVMIGCVEEESTLDLIISNEGRDAETFILDTNYGKLNRVEVTLDPGTSETVTLTASRDEVGTRDIRITAHSTTTYAHETKVVEMQTEVCYDSAVIVAPERNEICVGTEGSFSVIVRNTGTKSDNFILSSTGGWLQDDNLVVAPGESKETTLYFTPEELEEYELTVNAVGKTESFDTVYAVGANCKNVAVLLTPSERTVCETETTDYDIMIENTGRVRDEYTLVSNIGTLGKTEVALNPGESDTIDLQVDARKLGSGTHIIKVRAKSKNIEQVRDYSEVKLTVENCYDLNMNVVPNEVEIDAGDGVLVEVTLQNTGTYENTYYMGLQGPSWATMKPSEATIAPGQSKIAYVYIAAPFEISGDFEVKLMADDQSGTIQKVKTIMVSIGEADLPDEIPSVQPFFEWVKNAWYTVVRAFSSIGLAWGIVIAVGAGLIIVGLIIYKEIR